MKIGITGSEGFIGKYLVEELSKTNHELVLLDLSIGIDVCNWSQLQNISNIDVFIHLANKSFVPDSYKNPKSFYETNIISTLNILELCRKNNSKLIFLSSYVYGHPDYQPIDEKHPVRAFNPYAQSKIICESLCEGYSRDFKIPIIIFRPFNIYGIGQNESFLIPTIIKQAKDGKIVVKDDRPKRDYIYIEDVVSAIRKAIEYDPENGFDVFNLGSGKSYSVKEVIECVIEIFSKKIEYICTDEIRPNEILDTVAEINKAKTQLFWTSQKSLKEGLRLIIHGLKG